MKKKKTFADLLAAALAANEGTESPIERQPARLRLPR